MLAAIRGDAAEAALLTRAAAQVREHAIASDADLGPFLEVTPPADAELDRQVHQRLQHMYDAGAWVLMESAIADLPADLRWLFESGAVTIEQLGALHRTLGVTTAADLAGAAERQAIRTVPGLDAHAEYAIAAALFDLRAAIPRIPLGRAVTMVEPVLAQLRATAGIEWATPAGSLRRGQDTVGDVEIVAAAADPSAAIDAISQMPGVARLLHRSERRVYLSVDRVQLGIRFPAPALAGAALLHLTGSYAHLNALRAVARERGGRLTSEGYRPAASASMIAASEEEIYAAIGLPFIPPEIRQGDREVEAAVNGTLPPLVCRGDIRGDLHMHSLWSDGRDSIEAMVATCRTLGYEYCAITDHSPHSAASRNLSIADVTRQAAEIADVREKYADIIVLHGCEVDILPDGRLDLPDRVLERLDIVLASLHERAGQTPDQLQRRYDAAMRHPLVNLITHPTNRLLPHREGYDLDYDRLFQTAVETGTILEIDGAPAHLDMDGALARRAIAAGVMLSIDSDCHRAEHLDRQMNLGVTTARRGWVEARHVVNTRPIAAIRQLVARKRGR
ncbi:MAG TPA: PHP domain-containing protein [Vicinamibacterales bacterium]